MFNKGNSVEKSFPTPCILCGEKQVTDLFERRGLFFSKCPHCGLVYQDPPPSADKNREFYEENYYKSFGPSVEQIDEARIPLYRSVLGNCREFKQTGRLLDVGCGHGGFLKIAREEKWEIWGIEPSRDASSAAQKLLGGNILNGTVEEIDFPKGYFDVIALWNVIDCLPDPVRAMEKVCDWLSPTGVLIARTPNVFFHLWLYRFYSRFKSLLCYCGWKKEPSVFLRANFSAEAIRRLFSRVGFKWIKVDNASLTQRDAYQVFSNSGLMATAKICLSLLAQGMARISGNRFLISSSLMVCAGKEKFLNMGTSGATRIRVVLKKIALHLLAVAGYVSGLPLWAALGGKRNEIRILLYHSVDSSKRNDMNVRPAEFEKHLAYLKKHYNVISIEEAAACLKEKRLPVKPSVVITFDDGYIDNYRVVYPRLSKEGIPAAIFLLAGGEGSGRRTSSLEEVYRGEGELLSWEEAGEMADRGIFFGAHGITHLRLKALTSEDLKREIAGSKKEIEMRLKKPVRFFSYPYGTYEDFGEREKVAVREAGYEVAFSKVFGTNGVDADIYSLKRIGIEASDSLFTFRAKLNGALAVMSLFDLPFFRKTVRWINAVIFHDAPAAEKIEPCLLVSVDFPPHTDGVSTISRELSIQIAEAGKKMFVIGPKDKGDKEFDARYPYQAFRVPGYHWGYLRAIPILFCMLFVVFRYGIKKIFAMNIAYGGLLSWLLSFVKRLDYVIFAYGYEFEKVKRHSLARWLYLRIYGRAKAIICCSRAVRERLISFGAEAYKIKVLYPAVDFGRYYPSDVPRKYLEEKGLWGRKILLTTGRLVERKGHDQVIRALPEIIKCFPDVLYCISGIGPNEENLRKITRESGVVDYVRFLGRLPEKELLYLYNACALFIMPSREIEREGHIEGFGIVFLEANACGKPVIGGRSGGVLEAIQEGETGLLVNPDSCLEIAEKVVFLLSKPDEAKKMGSRGLDWVRKNFNWKQYVCESYEFLCGKELK